MVDLSTATETALSSESNSIKKSQLPPATVCIIRGRWTQCGTGGYTETGVTKTGDTIHLSHDDWQSPELACYPSKRMATFYRDGVAGAKTVSEVNGMALGDPDPKLFEIPEDVVPR